MKEEILEYYPNGCIKHKIGYYTNGNKRYEQYIDKKAKDHRENNLPDYQSWYNNGRLRRKTYNQHGIYYNTINPCTIQFKQNNKIWYKLYGLKSIYKKLFWANSIKNI